MSAKKVLDISKVLKNTKGEPMKDGNDPATLGRYLRMYINSMHVTLDQRMSVEQAGLGWELQKQFDQLADSGENELRMSIKQHDLLRALASDGRYIVGQDFQGPKCGKMPPGIMVQVSDMVEAAQSVEDVDVAATNGQAERRSKSRV